MDKTEEYGTLAVFTALAPLAVGGLAGLLMVPHLRSEPEVDWASLLVLATGLVALGVSVLHLGRPWRAPLTLRRMSTSWLSREVLLFGLFLVALGFYALLPILNLGMTILFLIGLAGVTIGLAGTVATGQIYRLHARPAWDHWLAVASFPLGAVSAGLLFGLFAGRQFHEGTEIAPDVRIAAEVCLVLALVVTWLRTTRGAATEEARASRQLALGPFGWLLALRAVAVMAALALIQIGGGAEFLAWIPALLGEFADRVLFFRTVVPVTLRSRYL